MITTNTAPPPLIKARMRHTRLLMLMLFPIVVFSIGMVNHESFTHEVMDWGGYVLIIVCVLGRAYCSVFIGGRKNDDLVTEGPFSVVRNPLYVFSFIGVVGIGLQSGMFTLLALLVLVFMTYYPRVIRQEEAFLMNRFGSDYQRYMAHVPRWWPRLSLWREPGEIPTRPRFIRETMMDASLFFLALPCFELLEALHENGMLPHYLLLP